uniref:Uncharacterized protein n=1 Tax=Lutzomyia longipalpis TaxID=7200 RepID=A0A1B0CUV5_LUTLO
PLPDGQPVGQNPPAVQPPVSQSAKSVQPTAAQLTQAANNLHVLSAAHLQQQMASFQSQALLYQQQQMQQAVSSSSAEPLALTRVVAEAAKQANGNVSVAPQVAVAHGNPTAAHQLHTTSLKLTYQMQHKTSAPQMQHKPPTAVPQQHKLATTTPAHMASQPTSIQHHTASVATATQAQVQHTPAGQQQQQPVVSQQKVPSPQKAAPPPQTRAPVAVATTTAAQSQLQANNNVPKAPSPQQVPTTPPKAAPVPGQAPKLATVVTPSKTTMKLATVTTPRIKQTARKNQAALTRPQSNFAAAAEAAAATSRPSAVATSTAAEPKATVTKEAPPAKEQQPVKKEKAKVSSTKSQSESSQDTTDGSSTGIKRSRTRTVPYQSPLPEFDLLSKLSYAESGSSGSKNSDDKLVLFYKNEFMAVRNADGGFFLCQTQQNVYKSSPRIRIQWLSEEKPDSKMYIPDFYDTTDLECVLTSVELKKKAKKLYELPAKELERIRNILKKAIDVEKGILPRPDVTEENPDGLDLSLYKDESQLEKGSGKKRRASGSPKRTKRTKVDEETPKRVSSRTKASPRKNFAESDIEESDFEDELPIKKATPAARGRPPAAKASPGPVVTTKQTAVKKTPIASPTKAPAKSKTTPAKSSAATTEVVVAETTKTRGRKRKIEPIDPLALPPAKKTPVQVTPDTPAAAATTGEML